MSSSDADKELDHLVKKIDWTQNLVKKRARIAQLGKKFDLKDTLPDISTFKLTANPRIDANDVVAEIFASAEKSGPGTDGYMVEAANLFNARNISIGGGKTAKIRIRFISSGPGYQFIAIKKYLPEAYCPSHALWADMIKAHGIKVTFVAKKLAGNYGGIVVKDEVYEKLKTKYGTVNLKTIVDATINGEIGMGYTDPFVSSTGFNFLISILATFANNDETKMLTKEVTSSFRNFQNGVPFVALNTPQMRDSVVKGGSLGAFVLDMKTWQSSELKTGYQFIPFGVPHDNPLMAIGNVSSDKMKVLKAYADFVQAQEMQTLAVKYGFNTELNYKAPFESFSGDVMVKAQTLWKEEKDAGRPTAAIFLSDISGSMSGERLKSLKKALTMGIDFIDQRNSIGLVTFNDKVNMLLPIQNFNLSHKSAFLSGIDSLSAEGRTAMYDGIAVSLKLLMQERKKNPKIRLMLFVLTDGESNVGFRMGHLEEIIVGLGIPIYTIGYEAKISDLKKLSSLVEAANINAKTEDVPYQIGMMLNAEL
jgi:Ca-activated chloride channel family protein